MRKVCYVFQVVVFVTVVFASFASFVGGVQASGGPEIAEPMVFDLVRGLGAKKGEIEINMLGQLNLQTQKGFAWAPEIEYALADGYAIELEIPLVDTKIKALKFAVQGTFGISAGGNFIHGWQSILEYFLEEAELEVAGLYLFGYRFHPAFSIFCMVGVEGSYIFSKQTPTVKGILNPSLFFDITRHLVFGIETNLSYGTTEGFAALIMPQLQFRFGRVVAVQAGVGAAYSNQTFAPMLAFRIVVQERLIETNGHFEKGKHKHRQPFSPLK